MRIRTVVAAAVAGLALPAGATGRAAADQPGPGDKQCIPGQQGNPYPAHKAGVCPNP